MRATRTPAGVSLARTGDRRRAAVDLASCVTMAWVIGLGLVATQAIGAALGSLIPGPAAPATGVPVYWLDLGMRSALLPDDAVVVEIERSWRHAETAGVLAT